MIYPRATDCVHRPHSMPFALGFLAVPPSPAAHHLMRGSRQGTVRQPPVHPITVGKPCSPRTAPKATEILQCLAICGYDTAQCYT
jgi:hypothetical protein